MSWSSKSTNSQLPVKNNHMKRNTYSYDGVRYDWWVLTAKLCGMIGGY